MDLASNTRTVYHGDFGRDVVTFLDVASSLSSCALNEEFIFLKFLDDAMVDGDCILCVDVISAVGELIRLLEL